jgi:hypothetical protein
VFFKTSWFFTPNAPNGGGGGGGGGGARLVEKGTGAGGRTGNCMEEVGMSAN